MPDFSTPEMTRAERVLDWRIDYALGKGRELQHKVAAVEEKLAREAAPVTDEEVAQFKGHILGHARTPEWQRVIDRIERGELTWRDVVQSMADARPAPSIAAAFASLSNVPPASTEPPPSATEEWPDDSPPWRG